MILPNKLCDIIQIYTEQTRFDAQVSSFSRVFIILFISELEVHFYAFTAGIYSVLYASGFFLRIVSNR